MYNHKHNVQNPVQKGIAFQALLSAAFSRTKNFVCQLKFT